jgi:hypothetical protein
MQTKFSSQLLSLKSLVLRCLLPLFFYFWFCSIALAQVWKVETIQTRVADGQPVKVGFASSTDKSNGIGHVVVYPRLYGPSQIKAEAVDGLAPFSSSNIWTLSAQKLLTLGVAVVYVDSPTDMHSAKPGLRAARTIIADLREIGAHLKRTFPYSQLHIGSLVATNELLLNASEIPNFQKIIVVGGAFESRADEALALKQSVLMFHAPSSQCDSAPFLEALRFAQLNKLTFVKAGYSKQENSATCSGQHSLIGLEAEFAKTVADWLDDRTIPIEIGTSNA